MSPATSLTRDDQENELEKQAKSLIISMIRFALERCDFVGISVSVLFKDFVFAYFNPNRTYVNVFDFSRG